MNKFCLFFVALITFSGFSLNAFSEEGKKEDNVKKETSEATEIKYAGEWLTDFEKATETAKALKRPILINFSGSDWCGWCIKLDKEVLAQKGFKDYAKENLVLFTADFPRSIPQAESIKKQNNALAKKYGVRGFPTVILVSESGDKLGETGYVPGGPKAFNASVRKILESAGKKPEAK